MMNDEENPSSEVASAQPSFEEALRRLEEIVHLLEEGDLGLNQALERYEEGVKLLRQSYELLNRAERRIELLSGVDAEGNPVTQPFDDTATFNVGQVANLPSNADDRSKRRSRRRSSPSRSPEYGTGDPQTGEIGIDEP
jgi:exodeoxyribonuclease VII small subunit